MQGYEYAGATCWWKLGRVCVAALTPRWGANITMNNEVKRCCMCVMKCVQLLGQFSRSL